MRQLVNYYFLAEGGVRKGLIKKYATKTKRHKVLVLKFCFPSCLRTLGTWWQNIAFPTASCSAILWVTYKNRVYA